MSRSLTRKATEVLAQQLLNGVAVGGVYALFALGFTLVFGIHRLLNLAQGAVFAVGSFAALYAVLRGLPLALAFLLAMAASGLLNVVVEILAFRRLRKHGEVEFGAIISSLGASMVIISVLQRVSATQVFRFPFETVPLTVYTVFGLRISLLQTVMVAASAVLVVVLSLLLYKTSAGRQAQAVAGNERTVMLFGIRPNAVYFQTFFLSGALAGAAGVLVGLSFNSIHFMMGEPFMLKGLVAIVLGGLGSIPGAVIAGLILGIVQTLTLAYAPGPLSDVLIFAILFVVLTLRPNGLFGTQFAEGIGKRR